MLTVEISFLYNTPGFTSCPCLCLPPRLHEFDEQVSAVREGMARVVPVPLLSLFTGYELETMVSTYRTSLQ